MIADEENRRCIYCENKWCLGHECQNPYLILFNPYDRDDGSDEGEDEELEEKTNVENESEVYSFDQELVPNDEKELVDQMVVEKIEQDLEQEFEEKSSRDSIVEFQVEEDQLGEANFTYYQAHWDNKLKTVKENEVVLPSKGNSLGRMVETELEKVAEKRIMEINDHTIVVEKSERELEKDLISSVKKFGTDFMGEFKQGEVKFSVHEMVTNWFCFNNWYRERIVTAPVYLGEWMFEYKRKLTRVFVKKIIRCGVKKNPGKLKIFQFDPGKYVSTSHKNINFAVYRSYFRDLEITHGKPDCNALVFKLKDGPEVVNCSELGGVDRVENKYEVWLILHELGKKIVGDISIKATSEMSLLCGVFYEKEVKRTRKSEVEQYVPFGFCFEPGGMKILMLTSVDSMLISVDLLVKFSCGIILLCRSFQSGQDATARIRVEHFINKQNIMDANELLVVFCDLLVARITIIEKQRECPSDFKEGKTSTMTHHNLEHEFRSQTIGRSDYSTNEDVPSPKIHDGTNLNRRHVYNVTPADSGIKFDEPDCDEEINMEDRDNDGLGTYPPPNRPAAQVPGIQAKLGPRVHPKLPDYVHLLLVLML